MQDHPRDYQTDASLPAAHSEAPRKKTRNRTTTACNTCRARRTRCDSKRPICGYCRSHGVQCRYEQSLSGFPSRVEAELAAINRRLDHITHLLPSSQQNTGSLPARDEVWERSTFTGEEKSPFQLLGTECMMTILGLGPGFARQLVTLERDAPPGPIGHAPRVRLIQQQEALAALAAFSAYVHVWYPILRPGFTERYLRVISGPLTPGPESCLVLLVAATGTLLQQDHALGISGLDTSSELYLEAAMISLPTVLSGNSIESVQCLVLLSIYYCCLSKPCQAYDYTMIASFKVQNLMKCIDTSGGELHEHTKRAFWAVLLLESELRVQFDVVGSGIWNHDDQVELPDSRRTWQFEIDVESPQSAAATSPASNMSADSTSVDRTQSYFLAEISMRRMLHRCNTAIRRTAEDEIVYAPGIAQELEFQLEEWHSCLPDMVRFTLLDYNNPPPVESLTNFLRVQYYCCKMSIYWPAVYQCIQDGTAPLEVLRHCERFFQAYIQLMPSLLMAIHNCVVNRWTLYASIFMTSMTTIQAAQTHCLRHGCMIDWSRLLTCLSSTKSVDAQIFRASPSLSLLNGALSRRLTDTYTSLGGTEALD